MPTDGLDPLIVLALLLPVTYVSIFVHELGHAVMGRAAGFVVSSFGIGTARPFLVMTVGGMRVFLCRSRPLQGLTFCYIPSFSPGRRRMVPFLAGGIVANGLLAVLALALWRWSPAGQVLWPTLLWVNGFLAVTNLVPFQKKIGATYLRSDGRLIVLALLKRTGSMPAPSFIQFEKALRGLWQSIGDRLVLQSNLHYSAACWVELGDLDRAEAELAEAGPLLEIRPPGLFARETLVRAAIAIARGKLAEAAAAIESARHSLREESDEIGVLYAEVARIQLLILGGDAARASAEIEALAASARARSYPPLRVELAATRLTVALARADTGEVEAALVHYHSLRKWQPSATRDLRVYSAVANYFAGLEDWEKAAPAFQTAIAAIEETATACAQPPMVAGFLERQAEFLMKAADCFRRLNKAEAAEKFVKPLLSASGFQRRISEAPHERNRRMFRIGLRLMAVDALCAVGLVAAAISLVIYFGRGPNGPIFFVLVAFEFMVFTAVAGLYLLFHATIGRLIPTLRESGGAVVLILSAIPWLALIITPLVLFLAWLF
jgi:tetratricopeptide (TPR) repeat protein